MSTVVEPVEGDDAVAIRVRAVPGASRDQIAGVLGDRLKVRVAKPPEDGRANRAICELIAAALGLRPAQVTLRSGPTSRDKVLLAHGIDAAAARQRLGIP